MKLIDLMPLQEIDFPNQRAFDQYNKVHKLRPDTKVTVAGRVTTAGRASQNSPSTVKGTSVFGGDDKEETSTSAIPKAEPGSFLDAFQKLNPGYDANKTLADFSKESEADLYDTDSDPEDIADHEAYVKSATEWFNKVATAKPTVKPGDLVKVNMKSTGKEGIGKIVEPVTMQGNYGFMGQVAPDKQPGWKIDCYTEKNIGTDKKPIDVNGKKYYYQGTLYYPQHEEGDKEAFSKLGGGDKKSTEDKPKQKLVFPDAKKKPVEEPFDGGVDVLDTVSDLLPPGTGFTNKKTGDKITVQRYDDDSMYVSYDKVPGKELKWPMKQFLKMTANKELQFTPKDKSTSNQQQSYNPAQAFNTKVSKMTDDNQHSAAAVELAIYMDDRESLAKLQQIKKYHDNRGYLQPGEAKERNAITSNLLAKAEKELPKKDYDLISSAF